MLRYTAVGQGPLDARLRPQFLAAEFLHGYMMLLVQALNRSCRADGAQRSYELVHNGGQADQIDLALVADESGEV